MWYMNMADLVALHENASLPEHLEIRGVPDSHCFPEVVRHLEYIG